MWDRDLHARIAAAPGLTAGVAMMWEAMDCYLRDRPDGKLLHDPLAACAVVDPEAFRWEEVEVVYGAGQWGARRLPGSSTFISIAVDWPRALATLVKPARLPGAA